MHRSSKFVFAIAAMALIPAAGAQQKQKGPPLPPLAACGTSGEAEVICGTRSPEDLEATPDGKFLIVAQFVRGEGGGMSLFDPAKKTYAAMAVTDEPLKDWGEAACPGPIGAMLAPHGTSLVRRSNGRWQLFVVNHGGRESIEMYELKQTGGNWGLVWHGCVVSQQAYNDVAALADGGFVATHPTAISTQGAPNPATAISGYVSRWAPGRGESELPGTRSAYPNGVTATADGRTMYYAVWRASEVHKYDLRENKETGMVKLSFMPDNLTWTRKNQVLAAGIKGVGGECDGAPCIQGFGVAAIDPAKMTAKTVFDSAGKPATISGVSVALQMGDAVYVGAFQGDRLVKIQWRE
jgi:hypothetical protein